MVRGVRLAKKSGFFYPKNPRDQYECRWRADVSQNKFRYLKDPLSDTIFGFNKGKI